MTRGNLTRGIMPNTREVEEALDARLKHLEER